MFLPFLKLITDEISVERGAPSDSDAVRGLARPRRARRPEAFHHVCGGGPPGSGWIRGTHRGALFGWNWPDRGAHLDGDGLVSGGSQRARLSFGYCEDHEGPEAHAYPDPSEWLSKSIWRTIYPIK